MLDVLQNCIHAQIVMNLRAFNSYWKKSHTEDMVCATGELMVLFRVEVSKHSRMYPFVHNYIPSKKSSPKFRGTHF